MAGVLESVALLSTTDSRPPSASTHPAGTSCGQRNKDRGSGRSNVSGQQGSLTGIEQGQVWLFGRGRESSCPSWITCVQSSDVKPCTRGMLTERVRPRPIAALHTCAPPRTRLQAGQRPAHPRADPGNARPPPSHLHAPRRTRLQAGQRPAHPRADPGNARPPPSRLHAPPRTRLQAGQRPAHHHVEARERGRLPVLRGGLGRAVRRRQNVHLHSRTDMNRRGASKQIQNPARAHTYALPRPAPEGSIETCSSARPVKWVPEVSNTAANP